MIKITVQEQIERVAQMIQDYGAENIIVVMHENNKTVIPDGLQVMNSKFVKETEIIFIHRKYFEPESWLGQSYEIKDQDE